MELTILQTADPLYYSPMLRITSRTAIEYCRRHGFAYESFVGIKRGFRGAHAAFNRILLLDELAARGYRGWALHMDADAYVYDLDFDLNGYLADKGDRAAIMATIPDSHVPWLINSGVLFFNLAHPGAVAIIAEWKRRFLCISEKQLREVTSVWEHSNDQTMLHEALNEDEALREPVLFEDAMLFNHHDGRFIRQYLNSYEGDLDSRTAKIAAAVEDVMSGERSTSARNTEDLIIAKIYRAILGREPDRGSRGYADLIAGKGLVTGIIEVVELLLDSTEYKQRFAAELDRDRSWWDRLRRRVISSAPKSQ